VTPTDLKTVREAIGLTQRALAERLGVPKDTLNRWERGRQACPHPEILRLALERLATR
jgi:DNA-binding transcriptional regulator YiaG